MSQGVGSACAQFSHWLKGGDRAVSQGFTLSILGHQEVWELPAHGHQVNTFHAVGVLASMKQFRKRASDAVVQYFREEMGEGSVLRKPHRILLGYTLKRNKK